MDLVRTGYHRLICRKNDCFLCAWETLAYTVLQNNKNPADPTRVTKVLQSSSPYYEIGEQFHAAEIINIVCNAYEDKCQKKNANTTS